MSIFANSARPGRGGLLLSLAAALSFSAFSVAAEEAATINIYDETAYTEYVESTMEKLDRLYLEFCETCGVEAASAAKARIELLATVRDLMKHMNARFDSLDPKAGAALSPTETLVSIE